MKNVAKLLLKNVLLPLGLTAAATGTVAAIHKKMFGSVRRPSDLVSCPSNLASYMTTLIMLNEKMNDIMKIVKSLE